MNPDQAQAEAFVAERHRGVLITLRGNGRPQASNIMYALSDGVIRISVTAGRAKVRNLARDPQASLHVTSDDFWRWVVVDGTVELSEVSTTPGDAAGRELAELYERIQGAPHPNWDEFYQAMVDDHRLVARLRPEHTYGQFR